MDRFFRVPVEVIQTSKSFVVVLLRADSQEEAERRAISAAKELPKTNKDHFNKIISNLDWEEKIYCIERADNSVEDPENYSIDLNIVRNETDREKRDKNPMWQCKSCGSSTLSEKTHCAWCRVPRITEQYTQDIKYKEQSKEETIKKLEENLKTVRQYKIDQLLKQRAEIGELREQLKTAHQYRMDQSGEQEARIEELEKELKAAHRYRILQLSKQEAQIKELEDQITQIKNSMIDIIKKGRTSHE